ncbi:MAG: molybdopterin-dependent oxidoreductase [Halobacteriales archaeon]
MRLAPPPRLVDGAILAAVATVAATGLGTAFAGVPAAAWVFDLHGVAGFALAVLLVFKFRRVAPRVGNAAAWNRTVAVSVATALIAVAGLATGVFWSLGGSFTVLAWNAMNLHVFVGLALVPLLAVHLLARWRPPRRVDVEGRRTALQAAALVGGSILAWRLRGALVALLGTAPSRRFTGSREAGAAPGNTFPSTSWVADDPDPIDPDGWRLTVRGAVERERSWSLGALPAGDGERATLDCTSGWYTTQDWRGVRVGRLLDAADPADGARWVSFRSVTGYRFSLPLGEARRALLATHVGDEPLSHGHGSPARLVAPGRRGFQWVKWVEAVEVRETPDYGQWIAIFTSGFTRGR